MNKYIATINVKGQVIKTAVFADSTMHARLMLQYQFGMNCIVTSPSLAVKEDLNYQPIEEVLKRIQPIKPIKIPTPQQARVNALKRKKETAAKALDDERARQKLARDQRRLFNLSRP